MKVFISFDKLIDLLKNIGMLWSLGKDSNVMVWIAFKAFLGKIPFPFGSC